MGMWVGGSWWTHRRASCPRFVRMTRDRDKADVHGGPWTGNTGVGGMGVQAWGSRAVCPIAPAAPSWVASPHSLRAWCLRGERWTLSSRYSRMGLVPQWQIRGQDCRDSPATAPLLSCSGHLRDGSPSGMGVPQQSRGRGRAARGPGCL